MGHWFHWVCWFLAVLSVHCATLNQHCTTHNHARSSVLPGERGWQTLLPFLLLSVWLQAVAKAFSQVLSTSPHVSVQAEVMDSVFDAFGKSDLCAAVVVSSGLLATLCALQPVFADKVGHSMQSGTACPANTTHLL